VSDVPLIYNHNRPLPKLTLGARLIGAVLSIGSLAVLVLAAWLNPSPSGVATHTQLGLPPCGLLQMAGIPCMTCGMTTSFAHLAHGHVWQSLVTQPAGTVLALVAAILFWAGGYVAITGRPSARLLGMVPWTRILFSLLGIVIVAWAYKIVVVVNSH
jgi:hypothetical protein